MTAYSWLARKDSVAGRDWMRGWMCCFGEKMLSVSWINTSVHVCQLYSVLNLLVITLLHLFSLTLTANVLVVFFLWGFPSACTIYVSNISLLLHRNNVVFFCGSRRHYFRRSANCIFSLFPRDSFPPHWWLQPGDYFSTQRTCPGWFKMQMIISALLPVLQEGCSTGPPCLTDI